MLYKELKKELHQLIETECSKHIGAKLDSGEGLMQNWHSIIDEISSQLNQFINKELKWCEISSHVFYKNAQLYLTIKNHLSYNTYHDFIRLIQITLVANTNNLEENEIISIQTSVNRIPIYPKEIDSFFSTSYPYLKSYQNKKIKMKDDLAYLTRKFYEELEKEYKIKYFNLVKAATECALDLYINHIQKNDFTSIEFSMGINKLDAIINPYILSCYTLNLILNIDEKISLREEINKSLVSNRIYSVVFEIFENGKKIKEENFQSLPMSQIKYYHAYLKGLFYEAIHTPACGTALIKMTITNVFTGKTKTVDDSFYY